MHKHFTWTTHHGTTPTIGTRLSLPIGTTRRIATVVATAPGRVLLAYQI